MAKTTTQLATAVLQELAVADASETPDAADTTFVQNAYADVWEELAGNGREIVYWPQAEIPLPVFNIVRDLVVLEVQNAFGKPIQFEEREARRAMILKRLYRHVAVESSKIPQKAVYY